MNREIGKQRQSNVVVFFVPSTFRPLYINELEDEVRRKPSRIAVPFFSIIDIKQPLSINFGTSSQPLGLALGVKILFQKLSI